MTLKAGFKQFNTDAYILYIVNEFRTLVVIVYLYDTLEIRDKPEFMNTIEWTKKEYVNISKGELEEFVGCTIERDITKMTLNISKPYFNYQYYSRI